MMTNLLGLLGILLTVLHHSDAGKCEAPEVKDGEVTGNGDGSVWTGDVRCLAGNTLVGSSKMKCRDGLWSGETPVCVKLDDCSEGELEGISNGWRTVYRRLKYRGAVHRYHCHKTFSLIGSELAWCDQGAWRYGGEEGPPVCARGGCEETLVTGLTHGRVHLADDGAYVEFLCHHPHQLRGQSQLHCNGTHWSGNRPLCEEEDNFDSQTARRTEYSTEANDIPGEAELYTEADNGLHRERTIYTNHSHIVLTSNVSLILNLLLFGQFVFTN